jgi:hypothetical protein
VFPAITEVDDEAKFIAERDSLGHLDARVILDDVIVFERIRVHEPDPTAIGELELMQMRQIPSGEPLIDCVRQPQNVCDDPTIKIRPGDGFNRAPCPPMRSTRT